jgi:hypothetical protein
MPASFNAVGEYDDSVYSRDLMYTAYEQFFRMFLTDWVVRTENPHEANLFYIPMMVGALTSAAPLSSPTALPPPPPPHSSPFCIHAAAEFLLQLKRRLDRATPI